MIKDILEWLEERNPEEHQQAQKRFDCLRGLGEAISVYPSVRETQYLHGIARNEEQLIEALCSFSSASHMLHTPTKVVAARSYLVAKYHAFSLLAMLSGDRGDFQAAVRRVIFSLISTLMVEEVYLSCLEEHSFSRPVKTEIANDLVNLWDTGSDLRAIRHQPALESLWAAREAAPPIFGTMDGNSELLRISIEMGNDWGDFLMEESTSDETQQALEEFLFGLSYEEIHQVRSRLARFGISAVDYNDVRSYLGSKPAYAFVNPGELRAVYDFFVERREAARFRIKTSASGPYHTLEELYLRYRILTEQE
ncbi:MAG: hypothetical protein LBT87_09910 [Treponema sp.]|nr:hypothetical protein [Treponema sp.]